jgi:RHH-type proline utilization regulon transcriptional repressor/proline dehydrogenase/delta 1-pyrroline-5-carboxylate dehydrogenase
VVQDPIGLVQARPGPHPRIPLPADIYGDRRNSLGVDLSSKEEAARLVRAVAALDAAGRLEAGPIVAGRTAASGEKLEVRSPADRHPPARACERATPQDIDAAFHAAETAQPGWDALGGPARAKVLRAMGDALEADGDRLIAIACRKAGKTLADGVSEVREAVDFCRYYA